MRLILDANVLFAALIKDGITSKLFHSKSLKLFTPEFIFLEFSKYEDIILDKTKRSKEDFRDFLEFLKDKIRIVPVDLFKDFLKEATEISPDPKDIAYIACSLAIKAKLWTNDKALKGNLQKVQVITTTELFELFKT
ncbi:MAG: hypothetical protein EU530_00520 [Promethearchaeota archaeon]|nr:MAG: hypothetical protein EU530_00520 [Candidatus Lokiarchaeota archaeon]